ncbi:MAG TPA: CHAT domain-containing protein, partial [Vicinamibacterales bacterium]|nr:CHAT domain-containing protein [Vicinamibacterales bacterium]
FTQGRLYSNIGLVYARQGHYREALEAHEKAVVLKQATSDAADVALTLLNIGNVHVEQRNYELALDYYTRSYAQLGPAGAESAAAANALNNIGTVNRALGRYDVALDNIQRSLAISERLGNRVAVATSTYNVALVASLQGRKPEALAGYRQSLALREAINDRVGVRECLDAIANVLLGMGEREEALRLAQRAVDLAREMKSNELLWQPLTTVGDIRRQTGDPAGAEAGYRQAIDAIETMRSELAGGAESRRRFFEDKLGTYRRLTSLLIETNRRADALAVAERARGRVLTDVLDGGDVAVRPLTADERAKQRGLERDVVVTTARLANAERRPRTDPAAVKEAQDAAARLRQARLSLDELRDALDARYPVRRLARGDAQPDPVAAAAAVLGDARTAIVEFAVADEATYVFVVTRPDASAAGQTPVVSAFTVPIASNALAARVEAYRRKLASRALDFQPDARALYDLLLKPARAALAGRTRLVIVPDAALWTIPFETLAPAAGRALIDDASVSYAPSIAVLRAMHERRAALDSKGGRPRIVIAADPASDLPKLPDAQRQALSLTALYGAARSRVFIGANATEPRVRAAASEATILHFATHGVVDDTNPMYSYLQLTRTGEVDAETDGRLEAWEILSLKLDAAVAVLTACDTARGTVGGGEGVVGLAWAFFAAGTP